MKYQLLIFEEVLSDIRQAMQWYSEQSKGLEVRFAVAIEEVIHQVLRAPLAFAVKYKNIRIAHPRKFPYNIHFYVDEPNSLVVITAIVHGKGHPISAQERI